MPIPFTEVESAILTEEGWEQEDPTFYTKGTTILLGCGCCSDREQRSVTKSEDGTYTVDYWPITGSSEHKSTENLLEALNWF